MAGGRSGAEVGFGEVWSILAPAGGDEGELSAAATSSSRHRFYYGQLTGNYPETGLEEITSGLLEADFWGVSRFHLSGQHVYRAF